MKSKNRIMQKIKSKLNQCTKFKKIYKKRISEKKLYSKHEEMLKNFGD